MDGAERDVGKVVYLRRTGAEQPPGGESRADRPGAGEQRVVYRGLVNVAQASAA